MKFRVRIYVEEITNDGFNCRNIREPEVIDCFNTLLDAEQFVASLMINGVKQCPKCNGIMGENIEGKPICACQQWPRSEDKQDNGVSADSRYGRDV